MTPGPLCVQIPCPHTTQAGKMRCRACQGVQQKPGSQDPGWSGAGRAYVSTIIFNYFYGKLYPCQNGLGRFRGMIMPDAVETLSTSQTVSENGHYTEQPNGNGKARKVAPQAFLAHAWRKGDPRLITNREKSLETKRQKKAKALLALQTGSNPEAILIAQVSDTRNAISRCVSADSRAKLTDTLLKLVRELAKLQAQARDQAPAPPKSGTVEPL